VAIPDPRQGEQIVLITDKPDADRDVLMAHAKDHGFPALWVPRSILVSCIPVLGSGKTDYSAAVDLAKRLQPML
jgi:acyl-[acyl-carrier-protein]-phospholipid O-acyltransferase/long-chain-fatty-acid--[acyl-carrier-protein] ligase